MHFLQVIFIWLVAFIIFVLGSTYFHEVSHFLVAKVVGFQVLGYRFYTIPFYRNGYVDVRIKGRFSFLLLRKACMHGSGLAVHLLFILVFFILFCFSETIIWKGIWIIGLIVNLYLFFINLFPEGSDGRQLFLLIRRYISDKGNNI